MHYIYRLFWSVRALLYKPFFASFGFPGYMGSPLFLMNTRRISIGRRVRIFPNMRAECHGSGRLFIHNNISIGQGFHVIAGGDLHIRNGCLISADVFITDTEHTYDDIDKPIFSQRNKISATDIGENCFLGIGVRIQAGTLLGKGCIVGANSVVRGKFPDYCVIVGSPARVVKRYDFASESWQRVT